MKREHKTITKVNNLGQTNNTLQHFLVGAGLICLELGVHPEPEGTMESVFWQGLPVLAWRYTTFIAHATLHSLMHCITLCFVFEPITGALYS